MATFLAITINAAPLQYIVSQIGPSGLYAPSVAAMNNGGQIVGDMTGPDGLRHAYLYFNGVITPIAGELQESSAYGINSGGDVVGWGVFIDRYSAAYWGSFRWAAAAGTTFFQWSNQFDINDAGRVATVGPAINNAGDVVGTINAGGIPHAALWYAQGQFVDLGTLGGSSRPYDVNDADEVVGASEFNGGNGATHAFLWQSGPGMIDLGTLGGPSSTARAINNAGDVVGVSDIAGSGGYHAFLYSSCQMLDLNDLIAPGSGWSLNSANAINDHGSIVGFGSYDGNNAAFLLTPIQPAPEPATVPLFAIGIAVLGLCRKRRKRVAR